MSNHKKLQLLLVIVAVSIILVCIVYGVAAAASNVTVSCTVPKTGSMTVSGTLPLNATVGSTVNTNLSITGIKTNCAWNVTVYKQGDLTDGTNTIPSGQLLFTSTGQGAPIEFPTSGSPATVRSGAKTGEAGTVNETVVYRLQLTYDEEASAYTATHVYTLNTP